MLPIYWRQETFEFAHDRHSHQEVDMTLKILRMGCTGQRMKNDVEERVRVRNCHCNMCARGSSRKFHIQTGHLIATKPLHIVVLDLTIVDISAEGYENILFVTDAFTKWQARS